MERKKCEECEPCVQHLSDAHEFFIYGVRHWLCDFHERRIMSESPGYLWQRYGSHMTAREMTAAVREQKR